MPDLLLKNEEGYGVYDDYRMATEYIYDTGKEEMPVSGGTSSDTLLVVQTSRPTMRKVVTFTARRTGAAPRLPHPESPEILGNDVLLRATIAASTPAPTGEGTILAEAVLGTYVYATKRPYPPWVQDAPRGAIPACTVQAANNKLPASMFDTSLLPGSP